jgi:hypothetical protein
MTIPEFLLLLVVFVAVAVGVNRLLHWLLERR